MDCSSTPEPAYLTLPGWRCVPVYAMPLSPTSRNGDGIPDSYLDVHSLLPSSLPKDPRQWSRQNVYTWLEWCVDQLSLPSVDVEQFHMNGKALCLLKKSDFRERVPRSGDVLFNALQLLLQKCVKKTVSTTNGLCSPTNVAVSSILQEVVQEKNSTSNMWSRSISSDFHSVGHVVHDSSHVNSNCINQINTDVDSTTVASPTPSTESEISQELQTVGVADNVKNQSINCINKTIATLPIHITDAITEHASTDKINVRLLWDFLQQLLNDSQQRYHCCIIWKDKARGVFKIVDPHKLACLWGMQKNHLNMNFDKMSRALRYYYRVRILQKEPGERHCYRFLRHPNELRHCKQRALLTKDSDNSSNTTAEAGDAETALDMTVKEECSSPVEMD